MGSNLAERVTSNAAATSGAAPAVQQRQEPSLTDKIRGMEKQFQLAMPKGAEAQQLIRDALTCLRQTPKLQDCESNSVLGALMTCSQLGLRPGVLGHAWVLPFWDNKSRGYKAQLVIGYQGLVELSYRSNQIASLSARTIFANDVYEVEYGLEEKLLHKPLMTGDRGEPVAYYAVVRFANGGSTYVVISHVEMLKYKQKYATAKSKEGNVFGPWKDEFEGMAHKTCLRQLSKWMPKSTELALAVENDGAVRVDLTPAAVETPQHIEGEIVDEAQTDPAVA
ncbi:recombinase [Rhodococcus qingshengii]|uniref:recombination protein RecT n=1 Tax=Rhodococcus TaxID=1827 RepID=UPI00097686FC|nr:MULTISPECIES: recombination protein RecT [Rhodococcus]AUS31676.1 recombinase [Rhodococcus qingshengii]MCC4304194.1 recombination protein RecT [Rhodococcus sp. 3-2]OMQ36739.1 recombinase [Rhodococcus sp. D-1]